MERVQDIDIVENPNAPIEGDVNRLTEYLGELNQALITPIKGRGGTTISPDMYIPTVGKQDVAVGQMSGPLGSMTIFSPGAPIFPSWLLDMADQQRRANELEQQNLIAQEMTEWGKIGELKVKGKHTEWIGGFQNLLNDWFNYNMQDVVSNYGYTPQGRMEFKRRLNQMQSKANIMADGMDAIYKVANEILTNKDPDKDLYVSEEVRKAAEAVLGFRYDDIVERYGGDVERAFNDLFVDVQKLYKVTGMSVAAKETIQAINDSIVQGDFQVIKSTNNTFLLTSEKYGGINAFINEKNELEGEGGYLMDMIAGAWESVYGRMNEHVRPSLEEYSKYILSRVKATAEKVTQTMGHVNYEQKLWYEKQLYYAKMQASMTQPSYQTIDINWDGIKTKADFIGSPDSFVVNVDASTIIRYLDDGSSRRWGDMMKEQKNSQDKAKKGGTTTDTDLKYGNSVMVDGFISIKNKYGFHEQYAVAYALKPESKTSHVGVSVRDDDMSFNAGYSTTDKNNKVDGRRILIPLDAVIANQGMNVGILKKWNMGFLGNAVQGHQVYTRDVKTEREIENTRMTWYRGSMVDLINGQFNMGATQEQSGGGQQSGGGEIVVKAILNGKPVEFTLSPENWEEMKKDFDSLKISYERIK